MKAPYLLFDAYGTIVELDDFLGRLQIGFARHGIVLPPAVMETAARAEMSHYIEHSLRARDTASYHQLRAECAGILAAGIREAGYKLDVPDDTVVEILGDAIMFKTFPDTLPALEALQALGIRMAVLSNWDFHIVEELAKIGLAPYFEFVQSSAGVGYAKPAPEFFEAAISHARTNHPELSKDDCWYVGDTYDKDILASRAVGLKPVWIVRHPLTETPTGCHTIGSLTDIPAVLRLV